LLELGLFLFLAFHVRILVLSVLHQSCGLGGPLFACLDLALLLLLHVLLELLLRGSVLSTHEHNSPNMECSTCTPKAPQRFDHIAILTNMRTSLKYFLIMTYLIHMKASGPPHRSISCSVSVILTPKSSPLRCA